MNKVVSYQPEKHLEQLSNWAKQWNWGPDVLSMMPTTGLIIEGVCATFLYETNSSVCFMEGFICNKEVEGVERDECLDLIVTSLFQLAKEKGFKYMKGDSRYQAVIDRALKLGFHLSPYKYQAVYRRL